MFPPAFPPPVLAESASAKASSRVYTEGGKTYSVTTTTVNGQTTTETKVYESGEPVVSSASAYARGETLGTTPIPSEALRKGGPPDLKPTTDNLPAGRQGPQPTTLLSFLQSLITNLLNLFRRG